jgi:hypothetical protein
MGGIYFPEKCRAETVQPHLEFENFKTRHKAVSSNVSPDWSVRFRGAMFGFFFFLFEKGKS